MTLPPKEQWTILKMPLIVTAIFLIVLVGGGYALRRSSAKTPPVVGAPAPAVSLRDLTFSKEGGEYVLYFSLCDASGHTVARTGDVQLKISQLGTIGIEGGAQFVNEIVLLDASFNVGLNSYRWVDTGGGWFFTERKLILPKRILDGQFKRPPPSGALGKISVQFRDATVASCQLYLQKRLLFP